MNKILFLKILIAFITFLIFLTLGGIVYALVNYKTTPKLLSRKTAPAVQTVKQPEPAEPEKIPEIFLELKKEEKIKKSESCGKMLCLHIKSDFGDDKIIIFDPEGLQIKAVLIAGRKHITK